MNDNDFKSSIAFAVAVVLIVFAFASCQVNQDRERTDMFVACMENYGDKATCLLLDTNQRGR